MNQPRYDSDGFENCYSLATCSVCGMEETWGGTIHGLRQIACLRCNRFTWHLVTPFVWPQNRHEPGDEETEIMAWVRAALWAGLGLAASCLFVWWLLS